MHTLTPLNQAIYFSFLLGWLALPIPLLVSLGLRGIRQQSAFLQDAALSCALSFGFYIFVKSNQVHGWGDRYFHGVIGCLILVAIARLGFALPVDWQTGRCDLCGGRRRGVAARSISTALFPSLRISSARLPMRMKCFTKPMPICSCSIRAWPFFLLICAATIPSCGSGRLF